MVALALIFGVLVVHASPPLRSRLALSVSSPTPEAGSRRVYRKTGSRITTGICGRFSIRREESLASMVDSIRATTNCQVPLWVTSCWMDEAPCSRNDVSDLPVAPLEPAVRLEDLAGARPSGEPHGLQYAAARYLAVREEREGRGGLAAIQQSDIHRRTSSVVNEGERVHHTGRTWQVNISADFQSDITGCAARRMSRTPRGARCRSRRSCSGRAVPRAAGAAGSQYPAPSR